MDNSGAMLTGWQQINYKWYYFNETTGLMASNILLQGYDIGSMVFGNISLII